jgi:vacuolar-type H+-ATPase subunit H
MLDETIKAILETEAQADEMIKEAMEDAKLMVVNADAEAEKIINNIKTKVKQDRKTVVLTSTEEGDKQYQAIVLMGVKQAEKLTENTDTAKAVSYIKEKVLSKYGNC